MVNLSGARRRAGKLAAALVLGAMAVGLAAGCGADQVKFPAQPASADANQAAYDVGGSGKSDFFMLADSAGRFDRIGYDDDGDGRPDRIVRLDAIDPARCRHLLIVLDGMPFDAVAEFYRQGHLRLFHPPQVLIASYPSLTDVCLEDAFGYLPTRGLEAKYYDRAGGQEVGGKWAYVAGRGEPFSGIIDYRDGFIDDALSYLYPKGMFNKEINDSKQDWDRNPRMDSIYYYVSSAAVGTRLGHEGHLLVLRRVEQLVNRLYYETGGLVKVTMMADHGQTGIACTEAGLDVLLTSKGWKLTDKVRADNEVCLTKFGIVTCASLVARQPARLADDLLTSPAVELLSYPQGDRVVVRTRDGCATIYTADGKTFEYACIRGDPLQLKPLLGAAVMPASSPAAASQATSASWATSQPAQVYRVNERDLLNRSVAQRAYYPDALIRLWRAHFAQVENPPSIIVSLDDKYFNGQSFFAKSVSIQSTHGALNWRNSATFIMSTIAPIDAPLRSTDVPAAMRKLTGRPFPPKAR
jgi:hypothetical protein